MGISVRKISVQILVHSCPLFASKYVIAIETFGLIDAISASCAGIEGSNPDGIFFSQSISYKIFINNIRVFF